MCARAPIRKLDLMKSVLNTKEPKCEMRYAAYVPSCIRTHVGIEILDFYETFYRICLYSLNLHDLKTYSLKSRSL